MYVPPVTKAARLRTGVARLATIISSSKISPIMSPTSSTCVSFSEGNLPKTCSFGMLRMLSEMLHMEGDEEIVFFPSFSALPFLFFATFSFRVIAQSTPAVSYSSRAHPHPYTATQTLKHDHRHPISFGEPGHASPDEQRRMHRPHRKSLTFTHFAQAAV